MTNDHIMSYTHTDIFSIQSPKIKGQPCGDVVGYHYDIDATTIILADGLGAGIKANITAEMCVSRFLGLIKNGASLREAFSAMVKTMNSAWGRHPSFSVFTVARILNNGNATILSYDSPAPILISGNHAKVLKDRVYTIENAIISENNGRIKQGESLLLMSDGITQAGMGRGLQNGWESEGVARFINKTLRARQNNGQELAEAIHQQALTVWGHKQGDDCTVILAKNRKGIIVNLLSGAPVNKNADNTMVNDFIKSRGIKVICGGTTAQIASRELKKSLIASDIQSSSVSPPGYKMDGITLVTEGIVTLNQVYNLLDGDAEYYEADNPVFELLDLLNNADRVNIFEGKSTNPTGGTIAFRQQGILPRRKILQLIKNKLVEKGKLVVGYEY